MNFVAERLKVCREEKGFTQNRFIDLLSDEGLKISRQTLINWEQGKSAPKIDEFVVLCLALDKPVGYFFNHKRNQTINDTSR